MRVLMVADFYAPYVGGVEQHVRSAAHALADRGHDVTVVTTATSVTPRGTARDGEVVIERIPTLSAALGRAHADRSRPWAPPIPDPVATVAIRRVIRRRRPDIVHGHDWLARSAAPWCGQRGPALVTTLHYYTRTCARKDLWRLDRRCSGPAPLRCIRCSMATYGRLTGPPVALATRLGAAMEDARTTVTVAVSDATAAGNGVTGAVVVPNPVAAPAASAPLAGAVVTEPPWDVPDGPYLLYVGDQRPPKGLPVLLEAYHRLLDPPPLVVVGDRSASDPVDPGPGVIRTGPLPHASVRALMAGALLVVVPSVWAEPFGLVAVEALAEGRPVVASDTGGLGELVIPDRTGVLVPPGDSAALADALAGLLGDPDRIERLARGASASAAAFASEIVAARLEDVYRQAVASRTRSTLEPPERQP